METREWKKLLKESLSESVPTAEEKITSHPSVYEWLQEAGYEASVGTQGVSDRTGMDAYHQLSNEFEERFSALLEAVDTITHGCGQVALDWQPGDPRRTRVQIDFGQEFPVHVYRHFDSISEAAVDRFLTGLADQLPKGAPYPKKPHRVGAVFSHPGMCGAIRLTEVVTDNDRRRHYVTIYRGGEEYRKDIPFEEAAQHVVAFVDTTLSEEEVS